MAQDPVRQKDRSETWLSRMRSNLYGLQLPDWRLRSPRRGRYIFTDNKHPARGIFSFLIGMLAIGTLIASVLVTYHGGAVADGRASTASLFAMLFAMIGLILGLLARKERDVYLLFPNLGIASSIIALLSVAGLLYLGLR